MLCLFTIKVASDTAHFDILPILFKGKVFADIYISIDLICSVNQFDNE